jgi:hypothetical protein
MLKMNLIAITLTSLLFACASNDLAQAQDMPINSNAPKEDPRRYTTSPATASLPVESTCDMDMTTGRRPMPIVDFRNPVLEHSRGFLPDGVISCNLRSEYLGEEKLRNYSEKGSYQGVEYEVFFSRGYLKVSATPDGKGLSSRTSPEWTINCTRDEMEESKTCSMKKGELFIQLGSDGESTSLALIVETYPNSEIAVKVGDNTKITAYSMSGLLSKAEIVEQMKSNSKLITSYYNWPYKVKKVDKHSLDGFSVGLILMKKLHKESIFH